MPDRAEEPDHTRGFPRLVRPYVKRLGRYAKRDTGGGSTNDRQRPDGPADAVRPSAVPSPTDGPTQPDAAPDAAPAKPVGWFESVQDDDQSGRRREVEALDTVTRPLPALPAGPTPPAPAVLPDPIPTTSPGSSTIPPGGAPAPEVSGTGRVPEVITPQVQVAYARRVPRAALPAAPEAPPRFPGGLTGASGPPGSSGPHTPTGSAGTGIFGLSAAIRPEQSRNTYTGHTPRPEQLGGPEMSKQEELARVIYDMRRSIPELHGVMIASNDGLPISHDFPQVEAERIAAMAATALGLGKRITERTNLGGLHETVVRGDHGYLVVYSAGENAILVMAGPITSNLGLMRIEARSASTLVSQVLR